MNPLYSVATGIGWPAVPSASAAQTLALVWQLEQSQWLAPDQLQQLQLAQLDRVFEHAAATVPFYRDRFAAAGLGRDTERSLESFRRVPLLTRTEMQTVGEALQSTSIPPEHGQLSRIYTSGSTGRPVVAVGTAVTGLFWKAFTLRDHLWHRRDFSQSLAAIRSFSDQRCDPPLGSTGDNWGIATQGLVPTGPCHSLSISATTEQQLDWLARVNPHMLLSYPSNLLMLARQSAAKRFRPSNLVEVRTFGELLEPHVRQACRQAWDVPVVDMYSSQEVGYIALQCPETENYHVQAEGLYVEVLDDAGRPCMPGQIGRIVVTTLHNFAMPLLRYDIGDFAEVAAPCSCGRGLPTLKRIVGRQRNMALLPDGGRRWPAIELHDQVGMADFPPIMQFQLIQRSLKMAELLLVAPRPLTGPEEKLLRHWTQQALGHPFEITLTYMQEIPRSASGKFEDFRCEVPQEEWARAGQRGETS